MKKHILIVSQYFYPEQFRINDIAVSLVERGYKVTVLTGVPNYPEGKFFKGYGRFKKTKEKYEGVSIRRIPIVSRGEHIIKLFLNYISFVFSGFFFAKLTRLKADVVLTYNISPVFQCQVGTWYAKRKKVPQILYVLDLWPENLEFIGHVKNKTILRAVYKFAQLMYLKSDVLLTASESFKQNIHNMSVPYEKMRFWPQYAESFYQPVAKDPDLDFPLKNTPHPILMFTGNVGHGQGLEVLVRAATRLKEEDILVHFVLIGDGRAKEGLLAMIHEANVQSYFTILPRQAAPSIPSYLAYADAGLVTLNDNPVFRSVIPAKLQSYLACGVPLIASATGEVEKIIADAQCGFVSEHGDDETLTKHIKAFIALSQEEKDTLAKNALAYAKAHYDKDKLLDTLEDYIEHGVKKNV